MTWNEALHPRGQGGRFGAGAVLRGHRDRSDVVEGLAVGRRSAAAFRPPKPAAQRRAKKEAVRAAVEVPRGVRPPKDWREQAKIEWQSPQKRAEQRALTGDVRMPRREAIRREASLARDDYGKDPTTGSKRTFTGKTRRVRATTPPVGARMTARGRFNLATHGQG